MKTFKAKKVPPQHDVWVSEFRLRVASPQRLAKVKRLLAKLEKEGFNEAVS